jgi:hypothetical protein
MEECACRFSAPAIVLPLAIVGEIGLYRGRRFSHRCLGERDFMAAARPSIGFCTARPAPVTDLRAITLLLLTSP